MDNRAKLLDRIHVIEREVILIKSELIPEKKVRSVGAVVGATNEWFRNYFPFISAIRI